MAYRVTISRVDTVQQTDREWKKLYDSNHPKVVNGEVDEQYGFVNDTYEKSKEHMIYTQDVEELDIEKVIGVVNKLT